MSGLTPAELREIRERADKATNGEWKCWNGWGPIEPGALYGIGRIGPDGSSFAGLLGSLDGKSGDLYATRDDAEFVAHSRVDVPALCDALVTAWGEVARLQVALEKIRRDTALTTGTTPDVTRLRAINRVARRALGGET